VLSTLAKHEHDHQQSATIRYTENSTGGGQQKFARYSKQQSNRE
jgi:hypothetical protein